MSNRLPDNFVLDLRPNLADHVPTVMEIQLAGELSHDNFKELIDALSKSFNQSGLFMPTRFFEQWFRKRGSAYFFLFKKNLKVTNLQFAELIALLQTNTRREGKTFSGLQLMSSNEFNIAVKRIVDAFNTHSAAKLPDLEKVAEHFTNLLSSCVVLDAFFGSAVVFFPPQLEPELVRICALSGYIHSCGPCLLVRNIDKVRKADLLGSLKGFFDERPEIGKPIRFVVYAHEDFTKHDRPYASELRDGLDDIKIYVEKYYFGSERLVEVLKSLEKEFRNSLHVMEAGPFKEANKKARELNCNTECAIWLLVDHAITDTRRQRGDNQYFVCYQQLYKNDNLFCIFDENKPAWVDHTTIPHTLVSAMLNLCIPWLPEGKKAVVGDPFAGTGTTLMEAIRLGMDTECSDLSPISDVLCKDNWTYFEMPVEDLKLLNSQLGQIQDLDVAQLLVPLKHQKDESRTVKGYKWALTLHTKMFPTDTVTSEFSESELDGPLRENEDILARTLLYILLRTERRHLSAFQRETDVWFQAYRNETQDLRAQLQDLIKRAEKIEAIPPESEIVSWEGEYSRTCCVDLRVVLKRTPDKSKTLIPQRDVNRFPRGSCDIIIADPPYGFNTQMDTDQLARIFVNFISMSLDALRDEGQVVVALPDWSHIGRQVPYFILKEVFTSQFFAAAHKHGREVITAAYTLPSPASILRPPYYWESARALRRAILHFRVRRKTQFGT